jgi:transposase
MKALARKLYLLDNKNEHEIAKKIGQPLETIFAWVHQEGWDRTRALAEASPAKMADNMARQILAFQQGIDDKEENPGRPTPDEINLQAKLLAGYNKTKHLSQAQVAQVLLGFMHFVADEEHSLYGRMMELYLQYIDQKPTGKNAEKAAPDAAPKPPAQPATTPAQEVAQKPVAAVEPPDDPFILDKKEHINGEQPPFSRQAFERNKQMLEQYHTGDKNSLVSFEGKMVKKGWLEYNLMQYYLPIDRRRFITDENTYPFKINHADTIVDIREFFIRARAA